MKDLIDRINSANPLHQLSESGYSPSEIKELIVATLSPFFENQKVLHETDVGMLVIEGVAVGKISTVPCGTEFLDSVLQVYRSAFNSDPKMTFELLNSWEARIQRGTTDFWSQCLFEVDKENLDLERFRFEAFRNIGALVEACIQPYLREGLALNALSLGLSGNAGGSITFGNVVAKYSSFFPYRAFLRPNPWGVTLSNWRNIAQHHSSRIEGDEIVVTYGRSGKEQSITLSRGELLDVLRDIQHRLGILKAARNIFIWDHIEEFRDLLEEAKSDEPLEDVKMGADTTFFIVASAIASQGFQVIDCSIALDEATFVVRDMHAGDGHKRIVHCSQFVVLIWQHYKSQSVKIRYMNSSGKLGATILVDGEIMESVTANQGLDWSKLSDGIQIIDEQTDAS